ALRCPDARLPDTPRLTPARPPRGPCPDRTVTYRAPFGRPPARTNAWDRLFRLPRPGRGGQSAAGRDQRRGLDADDPGVAGRCDRARLPPGHRGRPPLGVRRREAAGTRDPLRPEDRRDDRAQRGHTALIRRPGRSILTLDG